MSDIDIGKILVEALINRISWLDTFYGFKERELEAAKREVKEFRQLWEDERTLRCEQEEKLDEAITKLYDFIGLKRDDWQ